MKKLDKVATAFFGLALMVTPTALRLSVFTEDTDVFDAEFWGCMTVVAVLIGLATLSLALTKEEEQ